MAVIVMLSSRAAGFLMPFVLEMSCFNTREHCVTHKINTLDDLVKATRPAVWSISLCFSALRGILRLMLGHVGIWVWTRSESRCSHSPKALERKQTQTACLILPRSVPRPHGALLRHHSCLSSTRAAAHRALELQVALISTVPAPFGIPLWQMAKQPGEAKGGAPPNLFCLIASPLTSGGVWLHPAGQ